MQRRHTQRLGTRVGQPATVQLADCEATGKPRQVARDKMTNGKRAQHCNQLEATGQGPQCENGTGSGWLVSGTAC